MTDTNAVAIKLPSFWPNQPTIWFVQAESQFHIRNITNDTTKYHYVVSALDETTAGRIEDFLANPPTRNKYDALKTRLTDTFSLGRRERASRLLRLNGLGDRKPSVLMDEMLALAQGHTPCFLFEQIFLEQLPEELRLQLASQDFADPRKVALLADSIWLSRHHSPVTAPVYSVASPSKRNSVKPVKNYTSTDELCFYHAKFGKNAHKCKDPCKYSGNVQAGHH